MIEYLKTKIYPPGPIWAPQKKAFLPTTVTNKLSFGCNQFYWRWLPTGVNECWILSVYTTISFEKMLDLTEINFPSSLSIVVELITTINVTRFWWTVRKKQFLFVPFLPKFVLKKTPVTKIQLDFCPLEVFGNTTMLIKTSNEFQSRDSRNMSVHRNSNGGFGGSWFVLFDENVLSWPLLSSVKVFTRLNWIKQT